MNGVVLLEPVGELSNYRCRVRPRSNPRIVPLEGLHEGLGHAIFDCGLSTGVVHGTSPISLASARVSPAV